MLTDSLFLPILYKWSSPVSSNLPKQVVVLGSSSCCSLNFVVPWKQVGIFSLSEYWELLLTWCLCYLCLLFWLLTSLLAYAARSVRRDSRLFFVNAGSPDTSQDFPLVYKFEDPHLVLTFPKGIFPLPLECVINLCQATWRAPSLSSRPTFLPHLKCQPCLTMSMLPAWNWLSSSWMWR